MLKDGRLNVATLITQRVHYEHAADAYRLLRDEKNKSLGVVLTFKGSSQG